MTPADRNKDKQKHDRAGKFLFCLYILFVIAGIFLIGRIAYIQIFYKPDPKLVKYISPRVRKEITDPIRGSILADDGRLLASSAPMYQIYMDCTVQKEAYEKMKDRKEGNKKEQEWRGKAEKLSVGLAEIFKDKTAKEYYTTIISGRRNGRRYVKIGHMTDHGTLLKLKTLPLFNEPGYKGGMIVEKFDTRQYPYGALARRTIGYVRDNSNYDNNRIGIEGKYNYVLHGKEGITWMKETDNHGWIRNYDSTMVKVENGLDVKTTLNIEIQDIADKSLRKMISANEDLEGGCAIVMDVKTGAVKAMVNIKRNEKDGTVGETYNYAIGRAGDPGSVFKIASLMTLMEDGKADLETMVPTFRGKWEYKGRIMRDEYLEDMKKDSISVVDGLEISSNHVFRYLVCKYYEDNPRRFLDKLYEYKLNETFDFDIQGLATPTILSPDSRGWSGTALPSIAIGYTVLETPLHIVTFYNGIANRGKLMKPYLVESIMSEGKVKKEFRPEVLNGSICSRKTADKLGEALRQVVLEGTGRGLKNAKCEVAGKTGTARITFEVAVGDKKYVRYEDLEGRKQHQATFVGFYPYESPKYTAIVVVYSKLTKRNFYGAQYALPVFRDIVNGTCTVDPDRMQEVRKNGHVPRMKEPGLTDGKDNIIEVPDVKGLGLKDAVYSVENCGYRCEYEGTGHVRSQSPSAGTRLPEGGTVRLTLR